MPVETAERKDTQQNATAQSTPREDPFEQPSSRSSAPGVSSSASPTTGGGQTQATPPSQSQAGGTLPSGSQTAGAPGQQGMARRGRGSMSPWDRAMGTNPFSMMRQFADEMDRLFGSFGFPSLGRQWPGRSLLSDLEGRDVQAGPEQGRTQLAGGRALWAPQIDVSRRGDELVVCADLPGMNKEDIRVEIRDDQLILEGERRWEQEQGGDDEGFYRSERNYGRFFRTVPLPDGVNPEQAQASFRDGVLEIKMPLPEQQEQRGRRIEIR